MQRRQVGKHPFTVRGERHPDQAVIVPIGSRPHQTGLLRPMNELAGAVLTDEELLRDLPDRRGPALLEALHHDEELVLRRGDALGLGGVVAPAEEPA